MHVVNGKFIPHPYQVTIDTTTPRGRNVSTFFTQLGGRVMVVGPSYDDPRNMASTAFLCPWIDAGHLMLHMAYTGVHHGGRSWWVNPSPSSDILVLIDGQQIPTRKEEQGETEQTDGTQTHAFQGGFSITVSNGAGSVMDIRFSQFAKSQ